MPSMMAISKAKPEQYISVGKCCGLNEKDLHRLRHVNVCFPVGGTVWEGLGGVAF